MQQQPWRQALVDYIRIQARPVDKFSHQPRLYRLACRLAADQEFDDDVLFAAAWLHDLGVFIGHRPENPALLAKWDNLAYACAQAPELLAKFGFPPPKISQVIEVISSHLPGSQPRSFEAELLRDADILEQLGAVGILRAVSKVGRDTRFKRFSDVLRVLRKNADELPASLRLDTSRQCAGPRVRILKAFLDAAEAEEAAADSE